MPSFLPQAPVSGPNPNPMGTEGNDTHSSRVPDFGVLEQYFGLRIGDTSNVNQGPAYNAPITTTAAQGSSLQSGTLNKGQQANQVSAAGVNENSGESNMDSASNTEYSTDGEPDDKIQPTEMGAQSNALAISDSSDKSKEKPTDQKTLRKLALNREAARKSRLRKKAYIQKLETSRLKLAELEQELQRARQKRASISSSGDKSHTAGGRGALAFDAEYTRWLEEQSRLLYELRSAVNNHASETDLRTMLDNVTAHFNEIFRFKATAAKGDVFHILSGSWKTPAERCFMWIGGFRPSEVIKVLGKQLDPLTEEQVTRIHDLQQSSLQAEDALSAGMEALQQSLTGTLASASTNSEGSSGNVSNYMGQMAVAMGTLGHLEDFVCQADNLRKQSLNHVHQILTTRQSVRAVLVIYDYFSRLRALSSLWRTMPQE